MAEKSVDVAAAVTNGLCSTTATEEFVLEFEGNISPEGFQLGLSADGRSLKLTRSSAIDGRFKSNAPLIYETIDSKPIKTVIKREGSDEPLPKRAQRVVVPITQS